MVDERVIKFAHTLVNYCVEVREDDLVGIVAQPPATPLIQEVLREVLRQGGHPYLMPLGLPLPVMGYQDLDRIFFEEASQKQLQHQDRFYKDLCENFDVRIVIQSAYSTKNLNDIDPEKISERRRAYRDIMDTYFRRMQTKELRRVGTLFPTEAYAADAGMTLADFEDYVYSTTYSDSPDPIGEWIKIRDQQQKLVDWLDGKKQVQVSGPHIDLSLSIEGRKFINSDGKQNMPSGEIYTGPVEDSVEGWVHFTHPAILSGREVHGIKLEFEGGRVSKATADIGQDFLESMLEVDQGARYLGEFAIGTNHKINRFIKSILFDEKIGGTIHMALGKGYPSTGSQNNSAIHWDMICDMREGGQIKVDGELFYDSGKFLI
jgi:aminopeptidase